MPKQITGDEPANILTIRQEFAAKAMQAILTSDRGLHIMNGSLVKKSTEIADALIAELNKQL